MSTKRTGESIYNAIGQPDLASYLDRSVATVREYSGRFEKSYGTPAVTYAAESFEGYPILSAFVATFGVLSFLPIVTFIGISLFIVTSFLTVALFCALTAILFVELGLLSVFGTIIAIIFFVSIPLTCFAICTYVFARLVLHVRSGGREGVTHWADETKRHFVQGKAPTGVAPKADHDQTANGS